MTEQELRRVLEGIRPDDALKDQIEAAIHSGKRKPAHWNRPARILALAASLVIVIGLGGTLLANRMNLGLYGNQATAEGGAGGFMDGESEQKSEDLIEAAPAEKEDITAGTDAPMKGTQVFGAVGALEDGKLRFLLGDGSELILILSEEWQKVFEEESVSAGMLGEVRYDPSTMELLDFTKQ